MGYAVLHLPAPPACAGHADMQSNAAREAGGPDIAAGELGAQRGDPNYRDVMLERRLWQAPSSKLISRELRVKGMGGFIVGLS